jgi:hypothetical protein
MTAGETAGPSTSLRYGRDDNSVAGSTTVPSHLFRPLQNCHPVDKPKGLVKGKRVRGVAVSNSLAMSLET